MLLASRCPLSLQEASKRLQETGIISFTRQDQKRVNSLEFLPKSEGYSEENV